MIFWLIASVVMANDISADCLGRDGRSWGGTPLFRDDIEVGRAPLIPRGMDLLGLCSGAKALIPILVDPCFGWLPEFVWKKEGKQSHFDSSQTLPAQAKICATKAH
jgi:hypothetical protein